MIKKLTLTITAVLFATMSVFAQNMQVSGRVTSTDGTAIAGATVVVEGTNIGTTTDGDGKYTLSAPANGLLTFIKMHICKLIAHIYATVSYPKNIEQRNNSCKKEKFIALL